jgi:cell fate (sporulation/competence/biofilm development) regulator YlbF (YheA/YmcA/DUF963 family)
MEKILELAEQLGEAMAEHPTGKKYLAAKAELDADPTARQLIGDYEQTAMQIGQKEHQGRPIEPEEKRKLGEIQGKLAGNISIKHWMQAQMEYLNLLRQVNQQFMKSSPSLGE